MGTISRSQGIGAILRRSAFVAAQAIYQTLWIWTFRHRSRRELGELDERMLRDIGLTPDQAGRERSKPFWEA